MSKKLLRWAKENKLNLKKLEDNVFEIKDVGKYLLIAPKENDKIIGSDFDFLLSEEEYDRLEVEIEIDDKEKEGGKKLVKDIKYILFAFGGNFFFSELKTSKNEYNEIFYQPHFNLFKNIGKVLNDQTKEHLSLPFVNLGVHSEYELLNGSSEAGEWAGKAKFLGHSSLGICDKNTLGGTLPFQIACEKKGIKSILGETVSVAHGFDSEQEVQNLFDLKLYAKNEKGWRNLLRINKALNVDFPSLIPEEILLKYGEGLIAVFPKDSFFNENIDDKKIISNIIKLYKQTFDDIFYQIDTVEFETDKIDEKNLLNIKKYVTNYKPLIKPVLINDCYYVEKSDFGIKPYLNSIVKQNQYSSVDQFFKDSIESYEKISPLLKSEKSEKIIEEAFKNSLLISEQCNFKIDIGSHKLPKFEAPNTVQLFEDLLAEGIQKKVIDKGKDLEKYMERMQIEWDVIVPAGFVDYFLILWDVVRWAKENGILVGNGRGSVGGCLISFLLDITTIDPIEFDLLFERFINKTRVMPENYYDLVLEDGKVIKHLREGTTVKLKNGKFVLVGELTELSELDLNYNIKSL